MSIALLVFTDGRRPSYLEQAATSARAMLDGDITTRIIWTDATAPDLTRPLRRFEALGYDLVIDRTGTPGYAGAMRAARQHLLDRPEPFEWVFWCEDDFVFNRPVDVGAMVHVLAENPHLAQMALRRQPVNHLEIAAGGIVEMHPDSYIDQADADGHRWLTHRNFWTNNPNLHRRSLLAEPPWPDIKHSEGHYGIRLLEDPDLRFGFWGARSEAPWVNHIGEIPTIGDAR